MKVSFIIPHNGRYNLLIDTIASLIELDYSKNDFEVIIVSQNEDLTPQVFQALNLEGLNLKLIYYPGKNISAQRNFGLAQATGQFIAFIDADVALSSNWIHAMLDEFEKPDVAVASAVQRPTNNESLLEALRVALSNVDIDCDVDFLPGRNLFLTRQTVEHIGGFPEHLTTCEDYYFTDKAAHYGRLRYVSSATYAHLGEDRDYSTLWTKEVWRGQSNLLALKGRKIKLREWPSILAPLVVFLLVSLACINFVTINLVNGVLLILLACSVPVVYSIRLKRIAPNLPWHEIAKFYFTYFPARALGSVVGVFKSFDLKK